MKCLKSQKKKNQTVIHGDLRDGMVFSCESVCARTGTGSWGRGATLGAQ